MKVTKPGTLLFVGDQGNGRPHLTVCGWSFHCAGAPPTDEQRAIVVTAIRYLAQLHQVTLDAAPPEVPTPAPECFDAQRAALDAIAIARWRDE